MVHAALGQKHIERGLNDVRFTPKADIAECGWHVRFVPKADSCSAAILSLFDHLVGTGKYCRRNGEAECFCGFKIDHQLVLAGRLHR